MEVDADGLYSVIVRKRQRDGIWRARTLVLQVRSAESVCAGQPPLTGEEREKRLAHPTPYLNDEPIVGRKYTDSRIRKEIRVRFLSGALGRRYL